MISKDFDSQHWLEVIFQMLHSLLHLFGFDLGIRHRRQAKILIANTKSSFNNYLITVAVGELFSWAGRQKSHQNVMVLCLLWNWLFSLCAFLWGRVCSDQLGKFAVADAGGRSACSAFLWSNRTPRGSTRWCNWEATKQLAIKLLYTKK